MSIIYESNSMTFKKLEWDTEFFGIESAKLILHKPLVDTDFKKVKTLFQGYKFITIENRNSESQNAHFIGTETNAFLADVNIQFLKPLTACEYDNPCVKITDNLKYNERILEIAHFKYGRFTEDKNLVEKNGALVYRQWLINSFGKAGKYFALSYNDSNIIDGFVLSSYEGDICTVELIAVDSGSKSKGVGTALFKSAESKAYKDGCKEIHVGTQIRNTEAVNFYHKLGCRQTSCHQIYHLWNKIS